MNTSNVTIVSGQWCRSPTLDTDLEAQIITGVHTPFTLPAVPQQTRAAAAPSRTPVRDHTTAGSIDDFFGVSRPRATYESRHDTSSSASHVSLALCADVPPPPYADVSELPSYSAVSAEPVTFAMYLFKFGFLFPPFWLLGALILASPLRAPVDFEPTKTDAERQELVGAMRKVELKWAKRCAWALVVLGIIIGIMTGVAVAIMKTGA